MFVAHAFLLPSFTHSYCSVLYSHSLISYFSVRYIFIPREIHSIKKKNREKKGVCCGFFCTESVDQTPLLPRTLQGRPEVSLTDLCASASVSNAKPPHPVFPALKVDATWRLRFRRSDEPPARNVKRARDSL